MNDWQLKLYNELMELTKSGDAFYYQDFMLDDVHYRIFNYRLASYNEFLKPSGLEARGVMFEVEMDESDSSKLVPSRLVALPMAKFFNLNENPSTMNLDLSQIERIEVKADGSLMSTYMHNDELRLKSRGSLFSVQALAAMEWLDRPENVALKGILAIFTRVHCTVNLEWCSPVHRIVLGYMEPKLTVLNIRDIKNGDIINIDDVWWAPEYLIEQIKVDDPAAFIAGVPDMTNCEGYVAYGPWGAFKHKTAWYMSLHHAKDSVNNPRRLFECILDEAADDLRVMFSEDPVAMKMIAEMEEKIKPIYNHMVKMVEDYHAENKHLSRKDYAIKGQEHFKGTLNYFSLAMEKYIGREFSFKEHLKGKWRGLGLKDTSLEKSATE